MLSWSVTSCHLVGHRHGNLKSRRPENLSLILREKYRLYTSSAKNIRPIDNIEQENSKGNTTFR
jgi:hypothetical protein